MGLPRVTSFCLRRGYIAPGLKSWVHISNLPSLTQTVKQACLGRGSPWQFDSVAVLLVFQVFEMKYTKEKPKRKRKKKPEESEDKTKEIKSAAEQQPQSAPARNGTDAPGAAAPKKRRKQEKRGEKHTQKAAVASTTQEELIDVEDDDEDEDEDENCAAAKCGRPTGDEVGWVQCDQCELWFHLACVGLSSEKAESMDSYHCRLCLQQPPAAELSAARAASPADSVHIDVDTNTPTDSNQGSPEPASGTTSPIAAGHVDAAVAVGTDPSQPIDEKPTQPDAEGDSAVMEIS